MSSALRVWQRRPCTKSRRRRLWNCATLTSLLLQACMPSFPATPTPTCAVLIMSASLPPSPTASVVISGWNTCAYFTIAAFSCGLSRQHTTACALNATWKNLYCSPRRTSRRKKSPSIDTANGRLNRLRRARAKPLMYVGSKTVIASCRTRFSFSCYA